MNPFEPSADARVLAKQLGDNYKALVQEGFSPEEAFALLVIIINAVTQAKQS